MAPSLVVPVHLDALVANAGVLRRDGNLRWWPYNYSSLETFQSPEPEAFSGDTGTAVAGVYLHWTLPRALRHGAQSRTSGEIEYARVPNRWLVVRAAGSGAGPRAATAWVIESDCPYTDGVKQKLPDLSVAQTSMYLVDASIIEAWKSSSDPLRNSTSLDPASADPQIANLGIPFPLTESWTERAKDAGFLTAVGPGNEAFSIYYPHNVGVFSMCDVLDGVDDATLSYLVVGWYSDPADDVMAGWQGDSTADDAYAARLERLDWKVAGDAGTQATSSLYQGLALDLAWSRSGNPPPDDPLQAVRDSGQLEVSIGNTMVDAFTALVRQQLQAHGHPTRTVDLLQAFQYDLLPVLNQVNGAALLDAAIRNAWFGSEPGGYRWNIVATQSDGSAGTKLSAGESAWLTQLNRDQVTLDGALRDLYRLQWQLNAGWWKLGRYPNVWPEQPPIAQQDLERYLDPTNADGVTARAVQQLQAVTSALAGVPQPAGQNAASPEDAFRTGVAAFAQGKGLASDKVLKAETAPRYFLASSPVVLVAGVEPHPAVDPNDPLDVRLSSDLVTGFTVSGVQADVDSCGSAMPQVANTDGLPAEVPALLVEFFFVDPANAQAIATALGIDVAEVAAVLKAPASPAYAGPLPPFGLGPWSQPWNPLYLEWKAKYTHIPYQTGSQRNWSFDGTDYAYTSGTGAPQTADRDVSGISVLGPSAQFVFGKRLEDFLRKYPDADLSQLDTWIEQIDGWKLLAQELVGFNDRLALRDPRPFRRPTAHDTLGSGAAQVSVEALAGFPPSAGAGGGGQTLPSAYQGAVTSVPYLPNGPVLEFHGVRQGQLYFEELSIYDKFGRRLWLIEEGGQSGLFDAKNFELIRDASLEPDPKHVIHSEIASVVQLPPRVLQHGRLDFDLVDGADDSKLYGLDAGVDPVGGWVLPNHLDGSLLLYGPDGTSLGEFRLFAQADGSKRGQWEPPVHGSVSSLDEVGAVAPLVRALVEAPALADQAAFETFLQVIDESLWTIDPLGNRADQNLSVLVGRPLALVRTRLQLRTHGPAIRDTGWQATLEPPAPEFLQYEFGVRLGDQATRNDGVIGYFAGTDYGAFNSVVAPQTESAQSYVRQIGPVGAPGGNYVELRFADDSSAHLTMLVDPRASMHAITGILPVREVALPAGFVQAALHRIEVSFCTGPLLTSVGPTPAQGGRPPAFPNAVRYPAPSEQNGTWSWWEREPGAAAPPSWTGYDLVDVTPNARLEAAPHTLRDGVLQLVIDLGEDQPGHAGQPSPGGAVPLMAFAQQERPAMPDSSANPLLSYRFSTAPAPLQVSTADAATTGLINLAAFAGQTAVYCNEIMIAVPIGADASDLSESTPSASVNTAKWSVSDVEIKSGSELGLRDDTQYATFTFKTRDPSDDHIDYDLVFGLSAVVNTAPGQFDYLVREQSGTTSDPGQYTWKQATFQLDKALPQFYLENFVAASPSTPTAPATEFTMGSDIRFSWESNGTYFQVYAKSNPTPVYAGTATEFTLSGGVSTATTFVLVASVSGDPGGSAPAGFEPIYLYEALTITISNPALTPSSSTISGNAAVGGTLGVTGASTLHDTTADGTLTATGNANVGGSLGVTGPAKLGSSTVSGTLDVTGNSTLAGALVHGLLSGAGPVSVIGTPSGVSAGSYTAKTDGFVVGIAGNPAPADVSKLSVVWVTGQTAGLTVSATGGNDCSYFAASGSKLYWTMASNPSTFIMPVKNGNGWSVSVQYGQGNQVNPPVAFYWIPLGSDSAETAERLGDAPLQTESRAMATGTSDVDDSEQGNVDELMAVLIDLFGASMTAEKRQRLRAAIRAVVFQEVHKADS